MPSRDRLVRVCTVNVILLLAMTSLSLIETIQSQLDNHGKLYMNVYDLRCIFILARKVCFFFATKRV